MAQKNNFMLKVLDAGIPAVKKALKEAGITVESIIIVHKEKTEDDAPVEAKAKSD